MISLRTIKQLFAIFLVSYIACTPTYAKKLFKGKSNIAETKTKPFNLLVNNKATSVKDQFRSGTCWSFSTISMLESEIMRKGMDSIDLSEMFIVRKSYAEKGKRYVRMHGTINFGAGGAANDVTDMIGKWGIVPETVYDGKKSDTLKHVHSEMDKVLEEYLNVILKAPNKELSPVWEIGYNSVLDAYLGQVPEMFAYNGDVYTPQGFAKELDIKAEDYIILTSFTHHPFYEPFIMEVPDNWSWGKAYNLTLNELYNVAISALENNFTFVWATDVSEQGFDFKKGLAVAPKYLYTPQTEQEYRNWGKLEESEREEKLFDLGNVIELDVTQGIRQMGFDNHTTTDDHGMHVTGVATDSLGTKYFYVKNSWGTDNPYGGYLYASEAYFKLKTISIMLHKDAIPNEIKKKLKFK